MGVIDTNFPDTMTEQQIFDYVVTFLAKQGEKSVLPHGCAYRGIESTACAVGCLIRDDEYSPNMDRGINVMGDFVGYSVISLKDALPGRLQPHIDFLMELQAVHDTVYVEEWRDAFLLVAKEHSLNTDCLKVFEV